MYDEHHSPFDRIRMLICSLTDFAGDIKGVIVMSQQNSGHNNCIGAALKIVGIILIAIGILGVLVSLFMWEEISRNSSIWTGEFLFSAGINTSVPGVLLLGLGEVVNLLQDIRNSMNMVTRSAYDSRDQNQGNSQPFTATNNDDIPEL